MYDTITFLTDFGLDDTFVGVCHAVLARRAPHARVIDVTHAIARHDIVHGAVALERAVPYAPIGVHLAVVDPGVGSDRRGVAVVAARGDVLVGPDNGLLLPAARALGGVTAAFELREPAYRLTPTSRTFHGRDVFSPAAAAVASGTAPADLGPAVRDLTDLDVPRARPLDDGFEAPVVLIDRFGNCQLATGVAIPDVERVRVGAHTARVVTTFADLDAGELGIHLDSDGAPALTVNGGSAAERLALSRGEVVAVRTGA